MSNIDTTIVHWLGLVKFSVNTQYVIINLCLLPRVKDLDPFITRGVKKCTSFVILICVLAYQTVHVQLSCCVVSAMTQIASISGFRGRKSMPTYLVGIDPGTSHTPSA